MFSAKAIYKPVHQLSTLYSGQDSPFDADTISTNIDYPFETQQAKNYEDQ